MPDFTQLPAAPARARARSGIAWLLALVVVLVSHVRGADEHPNNQDRELDLLFARQMAHEGLIAHPCRSPLVPALLAPFEGDDPGFYERARWVGLVSGALALVLWMGAASRVFGRGVALLSALVLLPEWTFQVSRIRPEPIAAALIALAAERLARRAASRRPRLQVGLAGAVLGAAHLAKGSGPLTLAAAALYLATSERRRAVGHLLALFAGFVVVASPHLIDSTVRHGQPFFNANSAHVMWEERGEDQQWRWSEATPASWWEANGLRGSLARLAHGLLVVHHGFWLYAFLLACAIAALRRRARPSPPPDPAPARAWIGFAVATTLAWLPAFAWYVPIAIGRRYLFPVVALVVPALAHFLLRALAARHPRRFESLSLRASRVADALGRPVFGVSISLVLLGGLVAVHVREAAHPPASGPLAPFDAATLDAASRLRALDGARVLVGPAAAIPSPWLFYPHATDVYLPPGLGPRTRSWISSHADYVLLNRDLLTRRRDDLADLAHVGPDGGIVLDSSSTPMTWRIAGDYVLVPAFAIR
jgi:hypothetical protein